jgi:very-short-patch-repair endonuclease
VRLAARQNGVVSRRQLLAAGVPSGVIRGRVRAGAMTRIHRGVYQVGPVAAPRAREMAACLACGPTATLGHWTAASLWMMVRVARRHPIDVVVTDGKRARPGLRVHRALALPSDERTRLDGVPVTTPARTLMDLAATARPRTLERAFADALDRGLTTAADVQGLLDRHPGRPGTRGLRVILASGTPHLTRPEAEERFLRLIRRAGIERPETNHRVAGYEVDFFWPDARVIVEIDGAPYHTSPGAFERDRRRDSILAARGYQVVRITWRQLVDEPLAVAVRVARVLALACLG